MTKRDQLLATLIMLGAQDEPEQSHIEADRLLIEYIDDQEIADAYSLIEKWYS